MTSTSRKSWIKRLLAALLILVLLAAAKAVYEMYSRGFWKVPVYETEAPAIPELQRPALLVFSKTNSFEHKEAIPAAETLFRQLGQKNGWSVYVTKNAAVHNSDDLARFDTIIWNNVTGDVLTTEQRTAMKDWIDNGGGWIGLHGAGDSSSEWDWYIDSLVGARFTAHPYPNQFQQAALHPESDHSIVNHLPAPWVRTDEWYSFEGSPRTKGYNILVTIDEDSYELDFRGQDLSMGEDHPMIWKHCSGQGRALYSALGHTAASYSEPDYVSLLEQAVIWTAGLNGNECQNLSP